MVKFPLGFALFSALGAVFSYYVPGLADIFPWAGLLLASAVSLTLVLGTFPKDTRFLRQTCLFLLALAAGFSLGFTARRLAESGRPRFGLEAGKIAGLTGTLKDDPRSVAGGRGMAYLDLENTSGRDGLRASAQGEVLVFFPEEAVPRLRSFGRLSRVHIEGDFLPPGAGNGGPVFRAAAVHIMEAPPALERLRTGIRLGIAEKFSPHKWGGLALALLLGVRDSLDTELAASYREAGCSHILALSGMHLAIVSSVIAFLLRKPLGLKAAAAAGAFCIFLYAALVGAQLSLERAVLMSLLGTLTILGTFPRHPAVLLALAFVIQICIRPPSGDSLSFILSYLALTGILTLGDSINKLFRGKLPAFLSQSLGASLGAFIATAPVSAAFFGILYPVGIIAGLILVPLTTVFMIAAMVCLAAAFLLPPLTAPLGTALSALYEILSRIVLWAGRVPGIKTPGPVPVLIVSLAAAVVLAAFSKRRFEKGRRLAPFASA
jgi:competence protein ComEC